MEHRYEGVPITDSAARDLLTTLLVVMSALRASRLERDLYFMEIRDASIENGPIKIGVSADPYRRLADLQTSNPFTIRLRRTLPRLGLAERTLHALLAEYRLNGEWFRRVPEVLAIVDGDLPTSLLDMGAPSGARWGDLDRRDYDDEIDGVWRSAGGCEIWAACQRHLRTHIRHFGSLRDAHLAYSLQEAEEAAA